MRSSGPPDLIDVASRQLERRDLVGMAGSVLQVPKARKSSSSDIQLRDLLSRLHILLHNRSSSVSTKELGDVAYALGRLQCEEVLVTRVLKRIGELAHSQVEQLSTQDISGIVYSYGALSIHDESLFSMVAAEVVRKIQSFDQRQLSNTAWGFAKLCLWNAQLADVILAECHKKIWLFTPHSLSNLCWAMASWNARKEDLLKAIGDVTATKASEFSANCLAKTAWSFAHMHQDHPKMFVAIAAEATKIISTFHILELSHLAWAFATSRVEQPELFGAIANEASHNIKKAAPTVLTNLAWSFSKNHCYHEAFMTSIADESVIQLENFKGSEISMLMWSFALWSVVHEALLTEIGNQVAKRIETFDHTLLSHIAVAFSSLAFRHSEFLQALLRVVLERPCRFDAQSLSQIVYACGKLDFRECWSSLPEIAAHIAPGAKTMRPVVLARCAWAYFTLSCTCPELSKAIVSESLLKINDFPTKALVQLVDALIVCSCAEGIPGLEDALHKRLFDLAEGLRRMWLPAHSSSAAKDVSEEYGALLKKYSINNCGLVGTPRILRELGVHPPTRDFMLRCRKRPWVKRSLDSTSEEVTAICPSALAAAWLEVESGDQRLEQWVVHHRGEATGGRQWLWMLPGCGSGLSAQDDPTCHTLEDTVALIKALVVDPSSGEAHNAVGGRVQVLTTATPSLVCIGMLSQFLSFFPNIDLMLVDQVCAVT